MTQPALLQMFENKGITIKKKEYSVQYGKNISN